MLFVKFNQGGNIHIAYTIAICTAEILFSHVLRNSFDTTARHSVFARVYQRDAPWLGIALMHLHFVVLHVKCYVRHMQKVVSEILFDHITLIAAANNKIMDAVGRVGFHDVPQNRLSANLNHRLWPPGGFLTYSRS